VIAVFWRFKASFSRAYCQKSAPRPLHHAHACGPRRGTSACVRGPQGKREAQMTNTLAEWDVAGCSFSVAGAAHHAAAQADAMTMSAGQVVVRTNASRPLQMRVSGLIYVGSARTSRLRRIHDAVGLVCQAAARATPGFPTGTFETERAPHQDRNSVLSSSASESVRWRTSHLHA